MEPVRGCLGQELPDFRLGPGLALPRGVLGRFDKSCHVADELAFQDGRLQCGAEPA